MDFISYAQNFEDVMLWRALGHIERGFYIDVGANDPLIDSVTKAFYDRGWQGINIEPLAVHHAALAESRVRDINLRCGVGAEDGELNIWECEVRGWATMDAAVAASHERDGHYGSWQKICVRTLASICKEHVQTDIHFLKIDVEGFEFAVLQGMDFEKFRPWVCVIEATTPNKKEENYEKWEDYLLNNNYRFAYADGLNRFYVANEHSGLLAAFKYPPNVFDHFATYQLKLTAEWAKNNEDRAVLAELNAARVEERALQSDAALQDSEERTLMIEADLQGVMQSRSWRITAPLRWCAHQVRVFRSQGVLSRSLAFARRVVVRVLRPIFRAIDTPRVRNRLISITHKLGVYHLMRPAYRKLRAKVSKAYSRSLDGGVTDGLMTRNSRHIYMNLKAAIKRHTKR